jgi:hypothetical protein
VQSVNDAPTFRLAPEASLSIPEDSGQQIYPTFVVAKSAGAPDEAGQTLAFTTTNNNEALFTVQPAISANGTLTYTPAPNVFGTATVTVLLKDNGGTENGGTDTAAPQTFTIDIVPVNDAPRNTVPGEQLIRQGQVVVFSQENGNGLSIADPDAGNSPVQVSLSAGSGTLTLARTESLTFTTSTANNLVLAAARATSTPLWMG